MRIVNTSKEMTSGLASNLSQSLNKEYGVKKEASKTPDKKKIKTASKTDRSSANDFSSALNNLVESANIAEEQKSYRFAHLVDYFTKKAFAEHAYRNNIVKKAAFGEDEGVEGDFGVGIPEEAEGAMEGQKEVNDVIDILRMITNDRDMAGRIGATALDLAGTGNEVFAIQGNDRFVTQVMENFFAQENIQFASDMRGGDVHSTGDKMKELVSRLSWGRGWENHWVRDIMGEALKHNRNFDEMARRAKMNKQAFYAGLTKSAELFRGIGIEKVASEIESFVELIKV